MNITHVSMYDKGGAFQAAYRLQKSLRAEQINAVFLVLYQYNKHLKHVYSFLDKSGVLSRILQSLRFRNTQNRIKNLIGDKPRVEFRFSFSPFKIHTHELIMNADIIHLHWLAKFLDYPSFFKEVNKPVIWTLHDMLPFSGGFHYACYQNKLYDALNNQTVLEKTEALKSIQNLHIVAPSKWLYNLSKQSPILGRFTHHYIPYGLDINEFKPHEKNKVRELLGLPLNKKIILFVAESLKDKRKGLSYLLDALADIKQDDVMLLTLGGGTVLTDIPAKNYGYIDDTKQISMIYAAADVFVISSVEDNLPNTVMESLACGTPVVGFNIGGIPDMIQDGVNGFLVEEKDHIGLARQILEILNNKDLREQMCENARNIAVQEYSQELQAKRYIALYESVLKK